MVGRYPRAAHPCALPRPQESQVSTLVSFWGAFSHPHNRLPQHFMPSSQMSTLSPSPLPSLLPGVGGGSQCPSHSSRCCPGGRQEDVETTPLRPMVGPGPAVLFTKAERSFLSHTCSTFCHMCPQTVSPCKPKILKQFLPSSIFRFHSQPVFALTQRRRMSDAQNCSAPLMPVCHPWPQLELLYPLAMRWTFLKTYHWQIHPPTIKSWMAKYVWTIAWTQFRVSYAMEPLLSWHLKKMIGN